MFQEIPNMNLLNIPPKNVGPNENSYLLVNLQQNLCFFVSSILLSLEIQFCIKSVSIRYSLFKNQHIFALVTYQVSKNMALMVGS